MCCPLMVSLRIQLTDMSIKQDLNGLRVGFKALPIHTDHTGWHETIATPTGAAPITRQRTTRHGNREFPKPRGELHQHGSSQNKWHLVESNPLRQAPTEHDT